MRRLSRTLPLTNPPLLDTNCWGERYDVLSSSLYVVHTSVWPISSQLQKTLPAVQLPSGSAASIRLRTIFGAKTAGAAALSGEATSALTDKI